MDIQVNKTPIQYFNFSGGECHVNIADIIIEDTADITAYLYCSDDIMRLAMVVDAIRQKYVATKIDLTIPYFPYARQDRVCNDGEAFSVSVMAKLINALSCNNVTIYDPHSKITIDLLNNCSVITQAKILENSIIASDIKTRGLVLVSPDAGAESKTREIADQLSVDAIYCTKTRDAKTGQITGTQIPNDIVGQTFIIVDDICDGGRTFIQLAKSLKDAGANDLYLYVTHGIFSQGLSVLKEHFEHIYCYHCFLENGDIDQQFLTVIEGE